MQTPLPVDRYVKEIVAHVRNERFAVVVAPPGSGKTTRIPPALTAIGRTMLLQPRRVAARTLARRMASELGWTIGEEIGWQIRFERRFSSKTRLLVATEGILTARLQSDPLLTDFRVVVLDEFHERSIHADLALALVKEAARSRSDLAIVVMSATLDAQSVAAYLGGTRVFDIEAARYPVEIRYRPGLPLAQAVRETLPSAEGDILCFLPGAREIDRAAHDLGGIDALLLPLHGSLDAGAQERALGPASQRKVILATNIAETSLTVEGVTDVIDSGLHKVMRFDPETAVDHLVLERVSLDSAEQRAGRAGRTAPGRATRLWDARDILRPQREPDVRRVDLASTVLDIIGWNGDPQTFDWFERPPQERIAAALALLRQLGAIDLDPRRRLTPIGETLQRFPLHPRLARLILAAHGAEPAIAIAAALSGEIRLASSATTRSDAFALADDAPPHLVRELSSIVRRILRRGEADEEAILRAILAAYPDRVARRRESRSERLLLASGSGAVLAKESGVREGEFLVALDLAGTGSGDPLVRIASAIERDWLEPTRREKVHRLTGARVRAAEQLWYGAILLREQHAAIDPAVAERLVGQQLLSRIDPELTRRLAFAEIDADWDTIVSGAAAGQTHVPDVDLLTLLPHHVRRRLDPLAPECLTLPSGRRARLEYREDGSVIAAVKLQELFGLAETPRIGPLRTPVTFELLAPNGRPVQTTRDLRSFWNNTYPEVRKELRGRYPKHRWPEDPWSAKATHRTTRRTKR